MENILVLFLATFIIGILSGFGLGALLFWITYGKRVKSYFVVACETIERFDWMIDSLTDDECEENGDGNL